jgi:hypothetical protein
VIRAEVGFRLNGRLSCLERYSTYICLWPHSACCFLPFLSRMDLFRCFLVLSPTSAIRC